MGNAKDPLALQGERPAASDGAGKLPDARSQVNAGLNARILVIYDEEKAGYELESSLAQQFHEVRLVRTPDAAKNLLAHWTPDSIIMRLTPPDFAPLGFSAWLRCNSKFDRTYFIFVVPLDFNNETLQLECLASGADTTVSLPPNIPLLIARLQAVIRITDATRANRSVIEVGQFRIDNRRRRAWAGKSELNLTPREYEIFHRLLSSAGSVCDAGQLAPRGGGANPLAAKRTIDVHVFSLRKKLGKHGGLLETIQGEGYRISVAST